MQIRELNLKELYTIYDVLNEQYADLTYEEFEDLIYDMKYMDYKMIGILEKDVLIAYAGVCIQTTLRDKRHLKVFDFITSSKYDRKKYDDMMKKYLVDFAKVGMCEKVVY